MFPIMSADVSGKQNWNNGPTAHFSKQNWQPQEDKEEEGGGGVHLAKPEWQISWSLGGKESGIWQMAHSALLMILLCWCPPRARNQTAFCDLVQAISAQVAQRWRLVAQRCQVAEAQSATQKKKMEEDPHLSQHFASGARHVWNQSNCPYPHPYFGILPPTLQQKTDVMQLMIVELLANNSFSYLKRNRLASWLEGIKDWGKMWFFFFFFAILWFDDTFCVQPAQAALVVVGKLLSYY